MKPLLNDIAVEDLMKEGLPEEAKDFIKAEGFHISREIENLKVANREQYEKACEVGIANANILKRLEALRKSLVDPLNLEKRRIDEAFGKAASVFERNDEKIRKALEGYQNGVKVENIKTTHADLGRATVQERRDWEVENEAEIPKEYWKLDETKIGKIVRAGGSIPGIKIKTVLSTAFVAA